MNNHPNALLLVDGLAEILRFHLDKEFHIGVHACLGLLPSPCMGRKTVGRNLMLGVGVQMLDTCEKMRCVGGCCDYLHLCPRTVGGHGETLREVDALTSIVPACYISLHARRVGTCLQEALPAAVGRVSVHGTLPIPSQQTAHTHAVANNQHVGAIALLTLFCRGVELRHGKFGRFQPLAVEVNSRPLAHVDPQGIVGVLNHGAMTIDGIVGGEQ